MTNLQITQIVIEVALLLIGFYLAFIKSYFQEKGKNLATKEDIEEITELVEKVKHQIHFSTESKLNLRVEERNALVNYYEKYHYWLSRIMDAFFTFINEENANELLAMEQQLNEALFAHDIAQGRMNVFVKNEEIDKLASELKTQTLELQHIVSSACGELSLWCLKTKKMLSDNPPGPGRLEKYKKLLQEKIAIGEKCGDTRLEKYKENIFQNNWKLQNLIYDHLQALTNDD